MPSTPSTRRLLGDRYDLVEQIGRGGMGVVWRARDTLLERDVAVKEIQFPPGTTDEERMVLRQRVFREARAAARLAHPSVVTVYDVIEADGQPFIVMELIDAPSLTDIVRAEGPLSPARAAAIGLDVLSALEVAHEAGVVHRDIKPGNVMVPERGHCELADFGIASVQDDPSVTSTGLVLGSPAYMAPEQGSRGVTSPASDLWSLGATLFFAVEGVPPFEADGALPTLSAVINNEPQELRHAGPLAPIILALLDKDAARRPSHAAVRAELERVASSGDTSSAPTFVFHDNPYPGEPRAEETMQLVRTNRAAGAPVSATAALPTPVPTAAPGGFAPVGTPRREATADDYPQPARRRRGGGLLVALIAVAALIAAAIYGFMQLNDDTPASTTASPTPTASAPVATTPEATPSPAPTPKASASTRPVASAPAASKPAASKPAASKPAAPATSAAAPIEPAPAPAPSQAATSAAVVPAPAAGAPADWVSYTDPSTGYAIRKPSNWTVVRNGVNTDFKDPSTGAYLRVAYRTPPGDDATQAWRDYEPSFAARYPTYQRIRLEPTTFKGLTNASHWEYTYGRQHAVNLGFVLADRSYGFALNFVAPQSVWAASQPTFEAFKASFQPPG